LFAKGWCRFILRKQKCQARRIRKTAHDAQRMDDCSNGDGAVDAIRRLAKVCSRPRMAGSVTGPLVWALATHDLVRWTAAVDVITEEV
jgi:hypothetical protein